MHLVDGPNTGPGNTFVAGDPQAGTPSTTVTDDIANAWQFEIANAVQAAGLALVKADNTQLTQAIQLLSRWGVRRNLLSNHHWRLRQRGPGVTSQAVVNAAGQFSFDRWWFYPGGSPGAMSVGSNQVAVFGAPHALAKRYLDLRQTVGAATTAPYFGQRLEDLVYFGGKRVTLSAWLSVDSGTLTVTPEIVQHFGSGGGASADVVTGGSNFTVTTTVTRFSATIDIPSVAGKSYTSPFWMEVRFKLPTGVIKNLQVYLPQFQLGALSEPDDVPEFLDVLECLRFYETSYPKPGLYALGGEAFPGDVTELGAARGIASGVDVWCLNTRFLVPKRATPTIAWYSPVTGTAAKIDYNGADRTVSATTAPCSVATGWPVATNESISHARGHWVADAELF